jgi:hypothetical protein
MQEPAATASGRPPTGTTTEETSKAPDTWSGKEVANGGVNPQETAPIAADRDGADKENAAHAEKETTVQDEKDLT